MNVLPLSQPPMHETDVSHRSPIRIHYRIKNECAGTMLFMERWSRDPLNDGIEQSGDPPPFLSRNTQDFIRGTSEELHHFVTHALRIRCRKIDLIEHRNDRKIVLARHR